MIPRRTLASLTVGQFELDCPLPVARLKAADEKNRQGNGIPLRADLVSDLRAWIADGSRKKPASNDAKLFKVPAGLLRIFDRDLIAAELASSVRDPKTGKIKIDKRDERGRTLDLHALRHTFISHLSRGGVTPRVAQAAARHSDVKLTMQVYTDPKLLDVRAALDVLPGCQLPALPAEQGDVSRGELAPLLAPTSDSAGQILASCVTEAVQAAKDFCPVSDDLSVVPVNENSPLTTGVNELLEVERKGVEPSTSALRTQRSPN